jgi:DNA modification methylase
MKQQLLLEPKNRAIYVGDVIEVLRTFPAQSFHCIVFSPPYFNAVRYHINGAWGYEKSVFGYLQKFDLLLAELYRVLRDSGNCFVNIGDSYSTKSDGYIRKGSQYCVPEFVTIKAVENGWIKENTLKWHKPNASPTSAKNHFWINTEPVLYLVKKKPGHYLNLNPVMVPRTTKFQKFNRRVRDGFSGKLQKRFGSKWKVYEKEKSKYDKSGRKKQDLRGRADYTGFNARYDPTKHRKRNPGEIFTITKRPAPGFHLATYPVEFAERFLKCGCPPGGHVLDPFIGSGTTAIAAESLGLKWTGIDLKEDYAIRAIKRIGVGRVV